MPDQIIINRDYSDNISIKEFVVDELLPDYFPDTEISVRTSGTIGFVSEEISNISEDSFNTASVYFREAFANRAQIPESIYSHAAIFQLDEVFSTAAMCRFLLVLEEEAIIKNMVNYYDQDTGIYHFYIGRDTKIYVENIPFVFDYPVCLNIVKKESDNKIEYLFTANYLMNEYKNSISSVSSPYVKVRRNNNGYIALEVMCHQCLRTVEEIPIVSNNVINYPIIDVPFVGSLAGFDVLYQKPNEVGFNTQLKTLLVYSQAITDPFCYYQLLNENTIRITFNTKDNFYMPDFNSTIKVIMYTTKGAEGNFKTYDGDDVSITPDEESYKYAYQYIVATKPLGASQNGRDVSSITDIQSLAVEGYRTANALTTENDLSIFFANYKVRYGESNIKFIRKRDDVSERVFSAFILMKNGNYIYKTNTLHLKLNLSDFTVKENDVYILDPGYLFTANEADGYANFVVDTELNTEYYNEYLEAIEEGKIPFIEDIYDTSEIPAYLDRPASFAEFKRRKGYEDKLTIFDLGFEDMQPYDDPNLKKFLLINPFLIKFKKNPNLVSLYLTYVHDEYLIDFTNQNDDSFVQFITYTVTVNRDFEKEKKYTIRTVIGPSISVGPRHPIINPKTVNLEGVPVEYYLGDKFLVEDNDLRVLFVIYKDGAPSCFMEMYPIAYDEDTDNFTFECEFHTDDYITNNNKLRLLSGTIFRNYENGEYYKMHDDDATLYYHYDKNDVLLENDVPVDTVTLLTKAGVLRKFSDVNNMTAMSDIHIPLENVECKLYTIYKRYYSTELADLIEYTTEQTNNIFSEYSDSYNGYVWTNEYSTGVYPITFMKALDNVRVTLTFEDYTDATSKIDEETGEEKVVFKHDIFDVKLYSIPFMKWDIGYSKEAFANFMDIYTGIYDFTDTIMIEKLRNVTALDLKFYNTYGRSRNFFIGESKEIIDTVVLKLNMDIFYIPGTEFLSATPQVKAFIKETIETVNDDGQNDLYISNLIRKIENKFSFVDHLRFNSINYYAPEYQAVKNNTTDISELSVEERRLYVPEFLICDMDNIVLNEYYTNEY